LKPQEQKFHFVGIGGIGMCGLAELLHNMGAQVVGSDLHRNANTERLEKLGVKIFHGHSADQVKDADVVVYSSAVSSENPEIKYAKKNKIPLIPRAEALAEIMRLKRGIAVAGTHGKTTTTSLAASIFLEAQMEPTIVIGGRFELIKSTALLGKGEWMIAEADESDGSFSKLSPEIAIITNVDSDHLDFYKNFQNVQNAFYEFAKKVPFYGVCIVCGDDPLTLELFSNISKKVIFYGFNQSNDYVVSGENGKYSLQAHHQDLGNFELNVPGKHNALNATAAIIAALKVGISFEKCQQGLHKFSGVDRRFHFKGEVAGIKIYDDYGHHPTEVRATLSAFKEKYPNNRLVVLFQPHRYSRTQSCWQDFTQCFNQADLLLLTDIYPAGEIQIENVTSEKLSKEIKNTQCSYLARSTSLSTEIERNLKSGDVFLTLGAGDGWKHGMEILEMLKK